MNLGLQVHIHAIGDASVTHALNSIENAQSKNKTSNDNRRHHIAHLQLVKPDDIPRFVALGVTANFSPLWFQEDADMKKTQSTLGEERSLQQYPIKTMKNQGLSICFGSDFPVTFSIIIFHIFIILDLQIRYMELKWPLPIKHLNRIKKCGCPIKD